MNILKLTRRLSKPCALILAGAALAGCVGYVGPGGGGGVYVNTWGPDAYVFHGGYVGPVHDHDFARRGAASRAVAGVHGGGFHGVHR